MKKTPHQKRFYGATTVGEKGQVVIPADARKTMKLKSGDKLLVFGIGGEMVTFSKVSHLEKFVSHLTKKAEALEEIIRKSKQK